MVKLLQLSKESTADLHLAETVAVAITILSINNELNQDAVRSFSSPVRQVHSSRVRATKAKVEGIEKGIGGCSTDMA